MHDLDENTWKHVNENGRGFASWVASRQDGDIKIAKSDHNYEDIAIKWKRKNTSSIKTVSSIIRATSRFALTDFYDGNMMVRLPEGNVILNDPIFPNEC